MLTPEAEANVRPRTPLTSLTEGEPPASPDSTIASSPPRSLRGDADESDESDLPPSELTPYHTYQYLTAGWAETHYTVVASTLYRYFQARLPLQSELPILRKLAYQALIELKGKKERADVWTNRSRQSNVETIERQMQRWKLFYDLASDHLVVELTGEYLISEDFLPPAPSFPGSPLEIVHNTNKAPNLLPITRMVTPIDDDGAIRLASTHRFPTRAEIPTLLSEAQTKLAQLQKICIQQEALWGSIAALSYDLLPDTQRFASLAMLSTVSEEAASLLTLEEIQQLCGPLQETPRGINFKQGLTLTGWKTKITPKKTRDRLLYKLTANRILAPEKKERARFERIYQNRKAVISALDKFCNPSLHPSVRKMQYLRPLTFLPFSSLLNANEIRALLNPTKGLPERLSFFINLLQKRANPSLPPEERKRLISMWHAREAVFESIICLTNPKLSGEDRQRHLANLRLDFSDAIITLLCDPEHPNTRKEASGSSHATKSRRQIFNEIINSFKSEAESVVLYITYLQSYNKTASWTKVGKEEATRLYQQTKEIFVKLDDDLRQLGDTLALCQGRETSANHAIEETKLKIKKLTKMKIRFQDYYRTRLGETIEMPEINHEITTLSGFLDSTQQDAMLAEIEIAKILSEINKQTLTKNKRKALLDELERIYPEFQESRISPTVLFAPKVAPPHHDAPKPIAMPPVVRRLVIAGAE